MNINLYMVIGWIGMFILLLDYFLLSTKKLSSDSKVYHLLNLIGAIGIAISTLKTISWTSMTLSIIWAIIAIFSIYRIANTKYVYKRIR